MTYETVKVIFCYTEKTKNKILWHIHSLHVVHIEKEFIRAYNLLILVTKSSESDAVVVISIIVVVVFA